MAIQVLDQNTINKIAAGEVIERPASVVKELVENAIDAKATAITVEIKDGGISFIRITDNGCGINAKELPLAFLRHSTSKIKSIEDLVSVSSLGFRGEALSSIAAVSQIELITKTKDAFSGARYVIEGGKEQGLSEVGAPDGTTFIVRNLFYNTPVRRKFLKTAVTEAGYVSSMLEHIALSHPDISFRFINNNQNKLHTSGNANLKDIVYHVYGREISANLLTISDKTQDIEVEGFIGKPIISRGNRTYENYYINGRYIKSNIITKAVEEAYKGFIMMHKYPFLAMHFKINPQIIDVNVHPTKMELRFSQNEFVYNFVYNAVRKALTNRELIPEVKLPELKQVFAKTSDKKQADIKDIENIKPQKLHTSQVQNAGQVIESDKAVQAEKVLQSEQIVQSKQVSQSEQIACPKQIIKKERLPEPFEIKRSLDIIKEDEAEKEYIVNKQHSDNAKAEQLKLFSEDKLLDKANKNKHKIIGQLFDTYWLIEFEDKFFMMDQHAAHEKVLYENTMKKLENSDMATQMINPPIILSLNMREEQMLTEHMEVFTKLGYEIEEFGGNEYKVVGIPASLPDINNKELLLEMLDGLVSDNFSNTPDVIIEKVASMSCKAAVKGNNSLSAMEVNSLIEQLFEADNPYNCPHGRPTLISMTKYEIEKKFKRIV